jgi:hypothetical protein
MSLGYRSIRSLRSAAIALCALIGTSTLEAQPGIELDDVSCLSRARFTRFVATIRPPEEIREARLYFRSHLYSEFYFVDLARGKDSGAFHAVLPLPNRETTRVIYYVEAVDVSFQTSRSEDLEVPVSDESSCRPEPGGAPFPGGDPGIVVGATRAGAPALPSGFQASGITGFLSASGGAAAGGGGISAGVAIGAAAGAAAGVGVLVAGAGDGGGSEEPTGAPGGNGVPPSTTTSPASSTTTTTATISGSPAPPSTTTTTTPSPPPPTTTTTAPVTLSACFQWRALGNCQVFFDSCSTPESEIRTYEWRMLGPPVPDPPATKSFSFSFEADPRCRESKEFNHPVRLTIYDELDRSASIQQNISVKPGGALRSQAGEAVRLRFTSQLVAMPADGSIRGQLRVNGLPLPPGSNATTELHDVWVRSGAVVLEAATLTRAPEGSQWVLDFTSSENVLPESISVTMGTIASVEGRRIVLRLRGDGGEVLRLRLETR